MRNCRLSRFERKHKHRLSRVGEHFKRYRYSTIYVWTECKKELSRKLGRTKPENAKENDYGEEKGLLSTILYV